MTNQVRLRRIDLATTDVATLDGLLRRSAVPDPAIRSAAAEIVAAIRRDGDRALTRASATYGGGMPDAAVAVAPVRLRDELANLPRHERRALQHAIDNIRTAHRPQRPVPSDIDVEPGVRVERRWEPLRRVGVYVPGGRAAYPSSLLMGVVPAQVAGVGEVVVASPAGDDGYLSPVLLAAAALLEVDALYAMGGAQAIGALAYGTESVAAVDKIVGPGNAWVTAAKLAVYGDCAVDLPAGPSEALVLTDGSGGPGTAAVVAADLLCQAEHGPDSPVLLVSTDGAFTDRVLEELGRLLPTLQRHEILETSLRAHGAIVEASDMETAIDFSNRYAPEHLSVHTRDAGAVAAHLTAAGSVFVGRWSPESAGDYATGANHVLPTGGLAAAYGPLSVEDFGSWRQVQHLTEEGLRRLRPTIGTLASAEGLTAHKLAVEIRFDPTMDGNGMSANHAMPDRAADQGAS